MYLEFGCEIPLKQFGLLLSKRPPENGVPGIISECFSEKKHVHGSYGPSKAPDSNPDQIVYRISVFNSPQMFIKECREMNRSNYIHEEQHCVCPYNLRGIEDLFESLFQDNKCKQRVEDIDTWLDLGPWMEPLAAIQKFTLELGFDGRVESSPLGDRYIRFSKVTEPILLFRKIIFISNLRTHEHDMKVDEKSNLILIKKWRRDALSLGIDLLKSSWFTSRPYLMNRFQLFPTYRVRDRRGIQKEIKDLVERGKTDRDIAVDSDKDRGTTFIKTKKISLHEKRHTSILDSVKDILAEHPKNQPILIVEIGCNDGRLSKKIAKQFRNSRILLVDADRYILNTGWMKSKDDRKITFIQQNVLYPTSEPHEWTRKYGCTIMICCEVLEHFPSIKHAERFIGIARDYWRAQHILFTTPNKDYNIHYNNLSSKGTREHDHHFEFTTKELYHFRDHMLRNGYVTMERKIEPDCEMQRTHMLISHYTRGYMYPNHQKWQEDMKNDGISDGYCCPGFLNGPEKIFYLGPKMSPPDWNECNNHTLEHPMDAFDYFRSHGAKSVIVEKKYTGTRISIYFSAEGKVMAMNRNGIEVDIHKIMGSNDWYLLLIQNLKKNKMDYAILDCELLPWNARGEKRIHKELRLPAMAALRSRYYTCGPESIHYRNALEFLEVLSVFDVIDQKPHLIAFDLIAMTESGDRINTVDICEAWKVRRKTLETILQDVPSMASSEYEIVDLNDGQQMKEAIQRWYRECNNSDYQGWVVKSTERYDPKQKQNILPYMKVRGDRYLTLIYGMDYRSYIPIIARRDISKRRIQSDREFKRAYDILTTWKEGGTTVEHRHHVAEFLSMLNDDVDHTL